MVRITTFIILIISQTLYAKTNEEFLAEAFKNFKLGFYRKTTESLDKINNASTKKILATRYYLAGLSYNRLQEYDQSLIAFSKAKKFGSDAKDLYYEYGQALYANSELEKARKSFQLSAKEGYKKSSSIYYMAHISQLLEQNKKAKSLYLKVIKTEKEDQRLVQVARFQLSESLLAMAENKKNAAAIVKKYVLPQMTKAIKYLPHSDLAKDIEKRKKVIEKRYHLDPNIMRNGRPLPAKRWAVTVNQDLSFDNNVTFSTQAPTAASTQSESYVHNTYLSTNYLFSYKGLYTIKPKLDYTKAKHTDRENSSIFTNDSYSIIGSLNNTHEHKAFGRQASFLFDIGYTYYARDVYLRQEPSFFSRSTHVLLGEKFQYFSLGPSKFTFKYQDLTGYLPTNNYKSKTFSFEQIGITKKSHMWIFNASMAFFDNYNQTVDSTNQYIFNFNYYIPNIFYKTTLSFGASYTLLDTKEQQATRGTEKAFAPTISFVREVTKNLSATLSNTYTRNKSLDLTSFDYRKNVTSFGLSASF